jgi:NADPH:quinone reductase-like Zn-dependent oxidoreductase
MLRPGGRIVGVHPSPGNYLRSALPGPFHVFATQPNVADLETVVETAAAGTLQLPIARTVPLSQAIPALTELEQNRLGKRGKLIITAG